MNTADFTIAREMQRLREENEELRAIVKAMTAGANGDRFFEAACAVTNGRGAKANVLACLIAANGRNVSEERLIEAASIGGDYQSNTLKVFVTKTRRNIAEAGYQNPSIQRIWNHGYALSQPCAAWILSRFSGGNDVSRAS